MFIELEKGMHSNVGEAGGKGSSLLKLVNANYTVPYGFIIPADFFIETLKEAKGCNSCKIGMFCAGRVITTNVTAIVEEYNREPELGDPIISVGVNMRAINRDCINK